MSALLARECSCTFATHPYRHSGRCAHVGAPTPVSTIRYPCRHLAATAATAKHSRLSPTSVTGPGLLGLRSSGSFGIEPPDVDRFRHPPPALNSGTHYQTPELQRPLPLPKFDGLRAEKKNIYIYIYIVVYWLK